MVWSMRVVFLNRIFHWLCSTSLRGTSSWLTKNRVTPFFANSLCIDIFTFFANHWLKFLLQWICQQLQQLRTVQTTLYLRMTTRIQPILAYNTPMICFYPTPKKTNLLIFLVRAPIANRRCSRTTKTVLSIWQKTPTKGFCPPEMHQSRRRNQRWPQRSQPKINWEKNGRHKRMPSCWNSPTTGVKNVASGQRAPKNVSMVIENPVHVVNVLNFCAIQNAKRDAGPKKRTRGSPKQSKPHNSLAQNYNGTRLRNP